MLVCYDPYVGTLGKFSRAEIIELVAKAGYEGINLPIREPFIDGKDESQIEDTEKLLAKHNLVAPSIGFGNHIVTTPTMRKETMEHFAIVLNIAKRFKAGIIGIWPNMPQDTSVEAARETLAANLLEIMTKLPHIKQSWQWGSFLVRYTSQAAIAVNRAPMNSILKRS